VNVANFTIFLTRSVGGLSKKDSLNEDVRYELRYFGHASFAPLNDPRKGEARGLQLPSPGDNYADAFRTIYAAATEYLRPAGLESMDGKSAINKLRRLGFRLLGLEEFVEDL